MSRETPFAPKNNQGSDNTRGRVRGLIVPSALCVHEYNGHYCVADWVQTEHYPLSAKGGGKNECKRLFGGAGKASSIKGVLANRGNVCADAISGCWYKVCNVVLRDR